MHLDEMDWDPFFKQVMVTVPQSKVHRVKIIAFAAGSNRHNCIFTSMGDFFATNENRPICSTHTPTWLMPDLQKTNSPGMHPVPG